MTSVPKRTFPSHKVFAQGDFVEFIGFGCGSYLDGSVLAGRLHLRQPQRKVGHGGQVDAIPSDVLVATKRTMDTEALGVKDTFQSILFTDVSERTVLNFATISVSTQGHFGQIVHVQEPAYSEPNATE